MLRAKFIGIKIDLHKIDHHARSKMGVYINFIVPKRRGVMAKSLRFVQ